MLNSLLKLIIIVTIFNITACFGEEKNDLVEEARKEAEALRHLVWKNPDFLERKEGDIGPKIVFEMGVSDAIKRERAWARAVIQGAYWAETGTGPSALITPPHPDHKLSVKETAKLSRKIHKFCELPESPAWCRWMNQY